MLLKRCHFDRRKHTHKKNGRWKEKDNDHKKRSLSAADRNRTGTRSMLYGTRTVKWSVITKFVGKTWHFIGTV